MKLIMNTPLEVKHFDIDGFLALSSNQIKTGGELIIKQQNQVEFGTQWQIALDFSFAFVVVSGIYEPKSKLDFSKLASFKAMQTFTVHDLENLENENEVLDAVAKIFLKDYADEYNSRLIGTKVQIPFPTEVAKQLVQFREGVSLNLHKSIETVRNYPKS